jgi:hypothetical protein
MSMVADNIERFYSILARLRACPHQGECLGDQSRKTGLPTEGVYFFQEPGEYRTRQPDVLRIVRVGTHAVSQGSKATLWQRLRTHKGTDAGGGNHRGSIFRKHVGAAMLVRDGIDLPRWSIGSSAPHSVRIQEAEHEKRVSAYLGAMPVFWVAVPGESGPSNRRAFIERHAIALLSNHLRPTDKASAQWLGKSCPSDEVRHSGLWNVNHVNGDYDSRFLDELEGCVARTCQSGVAA